MHASKVRMECGAAYEVEVRYPGREQRCGRWADDIVLHASLLPNYFKRNPCLDSLSSSLCSSKHDNGKAIVAAEDAAECTASDYVPVRLL